MFDVVVGCSSCGSGCSCICSSCCCTTVVALVFAFVSFSFPFLTSAVLVLDELDVLVDVADGLTREVHVAVGEEVSCLSSDVLLAKYDVVEPAI